MNNRDNNFLHNTMESTSAIPFLLFFPCAFLTFGAIAKLTTSPLEGGPNRLIHLLGLCELLVAGIVFFIRKPLSIALLCIVYAGFIGYLIKFSVMGASSCGCFGAISLSPRTMLALDAVALTMSLASLALGFPQPRFKTAAMGWMATVLLGAITGFAVPIRLVAPAYHALSTVQWPRSSIAALEGKPLPFLHVLRSNGESDADASLANGVWKVLVYDRDCSKCIDTLEAIAVAQRSSEYISNQPLALIDVNNNHVPNNDRLKIRALRYFRLPQNESWEWELPLLITLRDGVVVSAKSHEIPT